jgi:hypothetical protein
MANKRLDPKKERERFAQLVGLAAGNARSPSAMLPRKGANVDL